MLSTELVKNAYFPHTVVKAQVATIPSQEKYILGLK